LKSETLKREKKRKREKEKKRKREKVLEKINNFEKSVIHHLK